MDEIFSKYLIPQMFAQVSQGKMSAADSVQSINSQVKDIYAKWKARRTRSGPALRGRRRERDPASGSLRGRDGDLLACGPDCWRAQASSTSSSAYVSTSIVIRPATRWSSSSR